MKLPVVDEDKIERIISFEAQQNVPFRSTKWSGTINSSVAAGGQIEVVLVAIKADLLDGINAAVKAQACERASGRGDDGAL